MLRFGKYGKLSPKFIGSYEVIECVGPVAYRLVLPLNLSRIHNIFHISMLRRYRSDPSHIIYEQPVDLKENLSYKEEPVSIIVKDQKILCNKVIPLVKVLWKNHPREEATLECEEDMRHRY